FMSSFLCGLLNMVWADGYTNRKLAMRLQTQRRMNSNLYPQFLRLEERGIGMAPLAIIRISKKWMESIACFIWAIPIKKRTLNGLGWQLLTISTAPGSDPMRPCSM